MVAVDSLVVKIKLDSTEFEKGINNLQGKFEALGRGMESRARQFRLVQAAGAEAIAPEPSKTSDSQIAKFSTTAAKFVTDNADALLEAGIKLDDAFTIIERRTKATGDVLATLKADFTGVLANVPDDVEVVARTLATLNRQTGLSGVALQNLTRNVLGTARILDANALMVVRKFAGALEEWQVPAAQAGRALEILFAKADNEHLSFNQAVEQVGDVRDALRESSPEGAGFESFDTIGRRADATLSVGEGRKILANSRLAGLSPVATRVAQSFENALPFISGVIDQFSNVIQKFSGLAEETQRKVAAGFAFPAVTGEVLETASQFSLPSVGAGLAVGADALINKVLSSLDGVSDFFDDFLEGMLLILSSPTFRMPTNIGADPGTPSKDTPVDPLNMAPSETPPSIFDDPMSLVSVPLEQAGAQSVAAVTKMVDGVEHQLITRMSAVLDEAGQVVSALPEPFEQAQQEIVTGSIVPDMIDAIWVEFGRLPAVMVAPTAAATAATAGRFDALAAAGEDSGRRIDRAMAQAGAAVGKVADDTSANLENLETAARESSRVLIDGLKAIAKDGRDAAEVLREIEKKLLDIGFKQFVDKPLEGLFDDLFGGIFPSSEKENPEAPDGAPGVIITDGAEDVAGGVLGGAAEAAPLNAAAATLQAAGLALNGAATQLSLAATTIATGLSGAATMLSTVASGALTVAANAHNTAAQALTRAAQALIQAAGGNGPGGGVLSGLFGGASGGGPAPSTGATGPFANISGVGPGAGPFSLFQDGGPIAAGELGIVGERGPELFVPKVPGRIIPNRALGAVAGGGGVTLAPGAIVIQTPDPGAFRETESQLMARLTDMLNHAQRNR